MKLLVITQKVDKNDPVLGAYHRWIEEFSKHAEHLTVICLERGESTLADKIKVLSLGKDEGLSKLGYLRRFYTYIWRERKNYDAVFVHMNEEYVLLAGLWWRLLGKRIGLFRNHIQGTWKTPIAVLLSNVVFCTSPHSYTAKFKKTKIVPAGTNLDKFRNAPDMVRAPKSVLSMGRISPVKNVDIFVKALELLNNDGVGFRASIVGDAEPSDATYYEDLLKEADALIEKGSVVFRPSVPNTKTPEMYKSHEIFVNMTNSGSFDKTVLSAMISGMIVVLCNVSFRGAVPEELIFAEGDDQDFARKLQTALSLSKEKQEEYANQMKRYVEENHSLEKTIDMVVKDLSPQK